MKATRIGMGVLVLALLAGCKSTPTTQVSQQEMLQSPLDALKAGNERFVSGYAIHSHQDVERRTEVAAGQHPIAIVVGCSDSRVPPEIVFDQGLGDLFVVRVAGNTVDDVGMGSIEYAAEHLHVKLIVVLGHDKCGAVEAAVSGADLPGQVQTVANAIKPAVEEARSEPGNLLDNAIDANIRRVVKQIKQQEPILEHEAGDGKIQIVGARYKLDSGEVVFFPQAGE